MMQPYYSDSFATLYLGHCLEVLPNLEDVCADLLVTDPPFSISVAGIGRWEQRYGRTDDLDIFDGDTDWSAMTATVVEAIGKAVPKLKPHGSLYAYVGHRQFGPLVKYLEETGWSTRFLVWSKLFPPPPAPGSGWPSAAELCVYAYRPGRIWTPKSVKDAPQTNVIVADTYRYGKPGKTGHPTQKPFETINPLLEVSSRPGDTVLDLFAGSGTTLVAAKLMGRKSIGIEINEGYAEMAADRLRQGVLFGMEAAS